MYYEYKASVNGEDTTVTMKGTNKDNSLPTNLPFAKYGLYKIETITPNGEITEASRVTRFSTAFQSAGSVATEKTSGTIRIARDVDIADCSKNTVVGLGQDIYAYNSDTIFMNVELKADGTVNKVSRSSANAINTTNDDIPGYSNVYVITVDDKDARTPVATLVYVVTPHESTFTEYTVTLTSGANVNAALKDANNATVASGSSVLQGSVLTLTATPATNYTAVVKVNGTAVAANQSGTYTITVTGSTKIEVSAVEDTSPVTVTVDADPIVGGARLVFKDVNTGAQVASVASGKTVTLDRNTEYKVEVTLGDTAFDSIKTLTASAGSVSEVGGFYYTTPAAGTSTLTVGVKTVTVTLNDTVTGTWTLNGATGNVENNKAPKGATVTLALTGNTKWTSDGTEFAANALGTVTGNVAAKVYDCVKVTLTKESPDLDNWTWVETSGTANDGIFYVKPGDQTGVSLMLDSASNGDWSADGSTLAVSDANLELTDKVAEADTYGVTYTLKVKATATGDIIDTLLAGW